MQHDMRKLINLVESLNESGDPILSGKANGKEIHLDSGVTLTLHSPSQDEDAENNPMVEYQIAADGERTDISATYYTDGTWYVLRDGSDLEELGGELMGRSLTELLNQVPDFSDEDDGGWDDDAYGLTSGERNR